MDLKTLNIISKHLYCHLKVNRVGAHNICVWGGGGCNCFAYGPGADLLSH